MTQMPGRPDVVPYIAAWSAERFARPAVVAAPGVGIAYRGEIPHDRDVDGVLWARMTLQRGSGRPEFGRVHPARQRRAMRRLLCQVCGGPADRTGEGVLWLLKDDRDDWPGWPEGMAVTHPPVCLGCARAAAQLCPHLATGFVAVRVADSGSCGVYGTLYQPGALGPQSVGEIITASDDPRARWVLAAQMVRVLRGCTFVELGTKAEVGAGPSVGLDDFLCAVTG
ncbi:hypothetical protein P3T36_002513 [Kitasatospora sp. MAP12-15]|uniref:hypothetical protein n=1 Tax=unclassified Kitasatospora TaxID=2633591 RepID=UPI002475FE05|nr:hypothetical protein [Kitasatospora sp. MAP12-44]MDH6112795.1 hypothetical protein [Kitasatospora sp. MAP12-44]